MDDRVKVESPIIKRVDLSKSLRLEVGRFNLQADTVVQGILEGGRAKQARTERMIQENIHRQETVVQERIEERCKSRRRSQYHRQAWLYPTVKLSVSGEINPADIRANHVVESRL